MSLWSGVSFVSPFIRRGHKKLTSFESFSAPIFLFILGKKIRGLIFGITKGCFIVARKSASYIITNQLVFETLDARGFPLLEGAKIPRRNKSVRN